MKKGAIFLKSRTLKFKSDRESEILALALMDSFINSETLEDFEKEVLIRLYHRLREDEELYYDREEDKNE